MSIHRYITDGGLRCVNKVHLDHNGIDIDVHWSKGEWLNSI